jgi:hypothetical protein
MNQLHLNSNPPTIPFAQFPNISPEIPNPNRAAPVVSHDKTVLLHTCVIFESTPRRNCACSRYLTPEEALLWLVKGNAREYGYTRCVRGKPIYCIKNDAVISTSLEHWFEKQDAEEFERRKSRYQRHQRERDAVFEKFKTKWAAKVRRSLAAYGHFTEASDDELADAARNDESAKWFGLVPDALVRVKPFNELLSDFWNALLDKENLSIYRAEKPVGGTYRLFYTDELFDVEDPTRFEDGVEFAAEEQQIMEVIACYERLEAADAEGKQ